MNKVAKAWVIRQFIVHGVPLPKLKTLNETSARVAIAVGMRVISDNETSTEQHGNGMSWRRWYMLHVTSEKVRHVTKHISAIAKEVILTSFDLTVKA